MSKHNGEEGEGVSSSLSSGDNKAFWRVAVTVSALCICAWLGTGVVLNGLVFGILMFVALYVICTRLPGMDAIIKKAGGVVDVIATIATFLLLGGTVTAMVAAATVGCLFTIMVSMKKWTNGQGVLDGFLSSCEAKLKEYADGMGQDDRDHGPDDRASGGGHPQCPSQAQDQEDDAGSSVEN